MSRARAMVSPGDIVTWFQNVEDVVMVKPGIQECFDDSSRIYNTVIRND